MIEKPGKQKKKKRKIERPKLLKCTRCKRETGSERLCHYEGEFKIKYGKGVGTKVNDKLISLLCMECDNIMAKKPDKGDIEALRLFEIEWAWLIIEYNLLND